MNELYFLLHIVTICLFVLGALKLGKEALIAIFCLQALLANLLTLQQMSFCTLTITCTDPYVIGCFFSLGLLQYYYGYDKANQAMYLCLSLLVFAVAMFQMHLLYNPSDHDMYHLTYDLLLSKTLKMILFSLFIGLASQKMTIIIQEFLKNTLLNSSKGIVRIIIIALPIAIVQLFDTLAFSLLAFREIAHQLMHIIFMSYFVKLVTLLCMTPFITLSKKIHPSPTL